jgi:hypothetical protein
MAGATTDTLPDTWSAGDRALIAIRENSAGSTGSWYSLDPIVTTIKWSPGNKPSEIVTATSLATLMVNKPQEIASLEFDAYWVGINATTSTDNEDIGPSQFFNGLSTGASFIDGTTGGVMVTTPIAVKKAYDVSVMFTNDTTATGESSTAQSTDAYRIVLYGARMTAMSGDYTDLVFKGNFKFEVPPRQKNPTKVRYLEASIRASNDDSGLSSAAYYIVNYLA